MVDARTRFQEEYGDALSQNLPVHTLLYADDTLLMDVSAQSLEKFMMLVAEFGKEYGLELNWKKVELLPIRCDAHILDPAGNDLHSAESIKYLGALLSNTGKIDSELNRRLGMAVADFKTLKQVWNHSSISRLDKLQIYITMW